MKDKDKFKNLVQTLGISKKEMAESLQVSESLLSAIEYGGRNFSLKLLNKIKDVYNIELYSDTPIKTESSIENSDPNIIALPYYPDVKAAAGFGKKVPESATKESLYFDKRWLKAVIGRNPENLSLIRAEGNSMEPTIKDGDLLFIDTSVKEILPNKIYIFKQEDDYRVKRLKTEFNGDIHILSDNPAYPTEIINKDSDIIGQVVWNGSKENL